MVRGSSRQIWPSNILVGFEQVPVVQDCIPTSLLKLSADNSTRAVKMFAGVQKYMAENGDAPVGAAKAELVQKLLHQVRKLTSLLLHSVSQLQCSHNSHKI